MGLPQVCHRFQQRSPRPLRLLAGIAVALTGRLVVSLLWSGLRLLQRYLKFLSTNVLMRGLRKVSYHVGQNATG